MRFSWAVLATVASVLSACGSSDNVSAGGEETGDPAEIVNTGPAKVLLEGPNQATKLRYDGGKDEIIVEAIPFDDEQFEGRYVRRRAQDVNGYQAYRSVNGIDNYVAFYRQTASGDASVAVVNSGEYADHGYSGATFERNTTTSLPDTTQRVFYNGKYIGTRTHEETGGLDIITGDAEMEADFSDDTFRGRIINRIMTQSETTVPVGGNITLKNSIFDRDNSTFSGEVAQSIGGVLGDGSYKGVFAGSDADETAGYLISTVEKTRELGVFTAVR